MMFTLRKAIALATAGLASTVSSLATYSPSGGPSYAVGIPSSSSISSSSTGTIYFQLSAPTTYQWVGFGIGTQMRGAKIFVMYADGNGNVTISARLGNQGHVEPSQNAALQAGVTLLDGSGIVGGNMVANVKCTTCQLDSSSTTDASPFIAAWSIGSAYNSASVSTHIQQHAQDNTSQYTLDLSQAGISSDSNPFTSTAATTSSPSGTGSSPATTSSSTGTVVGHSHNPNANGVFNKAHGIIMGITMVLLFPLGAIYMRLGGSALVHGAIQILAIACLIAGFGLGVQLAQYEDLLFSPSGRAATHTIFGTVIFGLFLIQPFLGLYHHLQYRKTSSRTPISHIHIWFGRIIILLGIINGGLGLQLAANATKGQLIAYGVVAGVVALAYTLLVVEKRKGHGKSFDGISGIKTERSTRRRP